MRFCRNEFWLVAATLCLAGCQVTLQPGTIRCGPEGNECPEGWSCEGELCVEDSTDAGPVDASRGDSVGGDGDVPGIDTGTGEDAGPRDAGPRDAGPGDAGLPEPTGLVFGGDGTTTLDAIHVVDGDTPEIFIAGTTTSMEFEIGEMGFVGGPAIYVAKLQITNDEFVTQWVNSIPAVDAVVAGVTVVNGVVIVVGSFSNMLNGTLSEGGSDDAFLIQFPADGGVMTQSPVIADTLDDEGFEGIASEGGRWCAVGRRGMEPILGLTERTEGGFIVCSNGMMEPNANHLEGAPAADIVMSGGQTWIAWLVPGGGATAAQVDAAASLTGTYRSGGRLQEPGTLVARGGGAPHLLVRESMMHSTLWYEAGENSEPTEFGTATETFQISGSFELAALDMVAEGDELYLVGSYEVFFQPTNADLTSADAAAGFLMHIDADGGSSAWRVGPGPANRLSVVALSARRLIVGGDAAGVIALPFSFSFPVTEGGIRQAFLAALPR